MPSFNISFHISSNGDGDQVALTVDMPSSASISRAVLSVHGLTGSGVGVLGHAFRRSNIHAPDQVGDLMVLVFERQVYLPLHADAERNARLTIVVAEDTIIQGMPPR